ASGLLYVSELIEEHSRLAKVIGQRGIYVILVLHGLLYLSDSLPLLHVAFSAGCHLVYLQNFSHTWPLISLTSPRLLPLVCWSLPTTFFGFSTLPVYHRMLDTLAPSAVLYPQRCARLHRDRYLLRDLCVGSPAIFVSKLECERQRSSGNYWCRGGRSGRRVKVHPKPGFPFPLHSTYAPQIYARPYV
ncbi:transmembrane adaptor Erv26-domain-containing protein, partial [Mycena sp. CBHHK59/15]